MLTSAGGPGWLLDQVPAQGINRVERGPGASFARELAHRLAGMPVRGPAEVQLNGPHTAAVHPLLQADEQVPYGITVIAGDEPAGLTYPRYARHQPSLIERLYYDVIRSEIWVGTTPLGTTMEGCL
jgi:hypothetical protein